MVFSDFFFVFQHLAIEFVCHRIDSSIHIAVGGFDMDIFPFQVQACTDFLIQLLHRQDHVQRNHVINVASDTVEFGHDVVAQGGSDLKMVAADVKIHVLLLSKKCAVVRTVLFLS